MNLQKEAHTKELSPFYTDIIFNNYPEGVVCKDSDLCYISANRVYRENFSRGGRADYLGKAFNKYFSEQNINIIHAADSEVKSGRYPLSYVISEKNDRLLSITTAPVVSDNEFYGLISSVKDITQEENIKERFVNKHFQQIQERELLQQQRETFVASVGHDLKNPTIAQIRGLELLLKGDFGSLSGEQSELLQMILDSCRYMNGMLSSLLVTYRNYGRGVKLNFEEFSLSKLVEECVSEMIYVAKDKDISVLLNSDKYIYPASFEVDVIVCADRVQIKRVIMNLLSNGIKYAYKKTKLKLSVSSDGDFAKFEFENRSPYISEEKQNSIFDRYVSYAGQYKELGIGLGLYASKRIVDSHQGKIYVQSFKDERNIFGFTIPVKQIKNSLTKICL